MNHGFSPFETVLSLLLLLYYIISLNSYLFQSPFSEFTFSPGDIRKNLEKNGLSTLPISLFLGTSLEKKNFRFAPQILLVGKEERRSLPCTHHHLPSFPQRRIIARPGIIQQKKKFLAERMIKLSSLLSSSHQILELECSFPFFFFFFPSAVPIFRGMRILFHPFRLSICHELKRIQNLQEIRGAMLIDTQTCI